MNETYIAKVSLRCNIMSRYIYISDSLNKLTPAATGTVVDDVKAKISHSDRVKADALCFKTSRLWKQ